MLSLCVLTYSMKAGKVYITKFTLEGDIKFWGAVLLSNLLIQIILRLCENLGHWLQYNVPAENLFLLRARLSFVV